MLSFCGTAFIEAFRFLLPISVDGDLLQCSFLEDIIFHPI